MTDTTTNNTPTHGLARNPSQEKHAALVAAYTKALDTVNNYPEPGELGYSETVDREVQGKADAAFGVLEDWKLSTEGATYLNLVNHENQVDTYLKGLKTFLMSPDNDRADWPDISPEQLDQVYGLVNAMLELKWGSDCDGDMPLDFTVWYRRTQRMVWDIPISHRDHRSDETLEQEEARLIDNLRNVSGGLSAHTTELGLIHGQLDTIRRRKMAYAAAFPVWIVRHTKDDAWLKSYMNDTPVSVYLTEDEANVAAHSKHVVMTRYWAIPNIYKDFKEHRAQVEAMCGKIVPLYGVVASVVCLSSVSDEYRKFLPVL